MASAKEIVLSEQLYELIPEPQDPPNETTETPPSLDRSQVPWDQRWTRTQYRSDPSEQIEDLVVQIWPDPAFRRCFGSRPGYLLAARAEDPPGVAGPSARTRWPRNWQRWCTATCATTACPSGNPTGVTVRRARRSADRPAQHRPRRPAASAANKSHTRDHRCANTTRPDRRRTAGDRGGAAAGAGGISHRHRLSCQHPHTCALRCQGPSAGEHRDDKTARRAARGRPSRHRRRAEPCSPRGQVGARYPRYSIRATTPSPANANSCATCSPVEQYRQSRSVGPQCALHRPRSGRRHLAGPMRHGGISPEAGFSNRVAAAAHSSGMRPTMRS